MRDSCRSCRFFSAANHECRKGAPRLALVEQRGQGPVKITMWPNVTPELVCGEYTHGPYSDMQTSPKREE